MKNFKYKKCFIVNRGEVLKRISSTLKKMDIQSVAIDDGSKLTRENVDILLDESADISTYLNQEKLISIAKKNEIDMIHPGYGFLSENYQFARNVAFNDIVWIGPNHNTIEVLANKFSSKMLAQKLNIPTVKYSKDIDPDKDIKDIKSLIQDFRYPLIIKSSYSGGGKGIRIVKKEEDLKLLIDQCAKESRRYFNDSSLLIEEYLEGFSHIEVQLLVDKYENFFVIGTRECSIQRKNQKLLEEASASISESVFKKLKKYSLDIAKNSSFESIGTVEFLVNKNTEEIYFMEVNPRLQVEHTVTESIYDIDLVELQIKIAHDFNLKKDKELFDKLKQIDDTNTANKHSIEIRLCSETPFSLLPCPGIKKIVPTFYKDHIRWDSGIEFNKDIEIEGGFDSLLTKIIVSGSNRQEVIDIFNQKLFLDAKIEGVTNWELFKSIFKENDFLNNNVNTQYLKTHIKQLESLSKNIENIENNKDKDRTSTNVDISYTPSLEEITSFAFSKNPTFTPRYNTVCTTTGFSRTNTSTTVGTGSYATSKNLDTKKIDTNDDSSNCDSNNMDSLNNIYPPVPGKILSLKVKKGDSINKNDVVCTIESMKMEIEVVSNYSGEIKSITDSSWVNTTDAIAQISPCAN